MKSGIYKIENTINGKIYIGSAVNLKQRWIQHLSELRRDIHNNGRLQNAWNKYKEEAFTFEVILYCEKHNLLMYEQIVLDFYKAADRNHGYNICVTAGSQLGLVRSEEVKKAQAERQRGSKRSEETRRRMSEAQKGEKNHRFGKSPTEEHRRKQSEAQTGKTIKDRGPEWRAKISASKTGKKISEETRQKMRNAIRKPHSEETKQKISEGIRKSR